MTLREARCKFSRLFAMLMLKAFELGYEAAFDEVTEHITERDKTSDHMTNSLHHLGLAGDVILYKNGVYLNMTEQYEELGLFWESLDADCKWGGRFGDGNHFSLAVPSLVGNRA